MNRAIAIGIASGLFQFGLACYAFRFARHLGKPRIGWSLFITLSFLSICTPLLSAKLHFEHVISATGVNILYTVFSVFLFFGLARFDLSLRKYRRVDRRDSMDDDIDELTRANTELQRRAGGLEKEIFEENDARKRLEDAYKNLFISSGAQLPAVMDRSQPELALRSQEPGVSPQPEPVLEAQSIAQPEPVPELTVPPVLAPEPEPVVISLAPLVISQPDPPIISLPQPILISQPEPEPQTNPASLPPPAPQPELEQQPPEIQPQEDVSLRPHIGILVNNVTASVNALAEHLARCEKASASFSRLAKLMNIHARNLGSSTNARSKQLPASLSQLSKQLADEQALLAKQIGSMKKRLSQINSALTIVPQAGPDHDPFASTDIELAPGEEQFLYSLHDGQTETAVTSESQPDGSSGTVVHEATVDGEEDEANVHPDDGGGDTGFIFR